jgi:butyrate kinase
MHESLRVFVTNPGSTNTKMAVFAPKGREAEETVDAPPAPGGLSDPLPARVEAAFAFLEKHGPRPLHAVVGRGGLVRPLRSGTFLVNEAMMEDARRGVQGEHPSNLGCLIADAVARRHGVPAFVVDPVTVDEMTPLAKYTGLPQVRRQALSHALNVRAAARKAAEKIGKPLADCRWVVAHLGGGISVVPLEGGRMTDCSNPLSSGPFSPNRAGALPSQPLIRMCFAGERTEKDLKRLTTQEGGLKAHLGTDDGREVEARVKAGDAKAREAFEAMAYQVSKEIGAMAASIGGRLDGVVLTGGLARSELFCGWVSGRVGFLGPVLRFPGEFEMEAMAAGAFRVLSGEERALGYPGGEPCGT